MKEKRISRAEAFRCVPLAKLSFPFLPYLPQDALSRRSHTEDHNSQPREATPLTDVNQRHEHLIEIKYCEDTRPGQQLEAAQRQHANLCKLVDAKVVTLRTILLG
eukprot:529661-Pelagomonas_calceolata.AAC.1